MSTIQTYLTTLTEKLQSYSKKANLDTLEDILTLKEIIDHLIRTTKVPLPLVSKFMHLKKIIKSLNNKLEPQESKPLFTKKERTFDLQDLPERVNELICLNECIASAISYQKENIDNLCVQMAQDEICVDRQMSELDSALRHRRRKNKFYSFVLVFFGMVIFFVLIIRIMLR
ncbi:hypothetical protein TUBRATIS_18760 [Tubulinosema ratisbonensis]|uniref:Uncharacterized protein n=1 Tax=Tubulinosema ratisbonensis TaxID=291195 RepID=A0A437AKN7_9MICR|nr:hypothetical protein TUBRATIS_18760 [Tubulinosema ratisbonensis]